MLDSLLLQVTDLIGEGERGRYLAALEEIKKTRATADKIELAKDLLPPILRPGETNPLKTLYETLSEGLHADTDERCLELAMEIREILVFLCTQVAASRHAARSFTEGMKALLDKKAERVGKEKPGDQTRQ